MSCTHPAAADLETSPALLFPQVFVRLLSTSYEAKTVSSACISLAVRNGIDRNTAQRCQKCNKDPFRAVESVGADPQSLKLNSFCSPRQQQCCCSTCGLTQNPKAFGKGRLRAVAPYTLSSIGTARGFHRHIPRSRKLDTEMVSRTPFPRPMTHCGTRKYVTSCHRFSAEEG